MSICSTTLTATATQATATPARDRGDFLLRFRSLFNAGRGYSFPCDARGQVELDRLTDRERLNYLFARAVIGRELHMPEVVPHGPAWNGQGRT